MSHVTCNTYYASPSAPHPFCQPVIRKLQECFNALDDDLKDDLYRETKNIIKEKEMTVLMVTHDKAESQIFSNKIINLENGKIRE